MSAERAGPPTSPKNESSWAPVYHLPADYDPFDGTHALGVAAEAYAALLGWRVVPLYGVRADGACECGRERHGSDVGKHPRLKDWPLQATADRATIRAWWRRWPRANVGIATGQTSGFVVLDVDVHHGALDILEALQAAQEPLPDGPLSLTGSGGFHRLFRAPAHPTPNPVGEAGLGAGLDVRGDGGQIVAPPSWHYSGRRYLWETSAHPLDVPLPPWPAWLDALVHRGARPSEAPVAAAGEDPAWLQIAVKGPVGEGQRHATAVSLIGHLLRRRVDPRIAVQLLLAWNSALCDPPLPSDEILRIADGIAGRERARRKEQGRG